jgi:hypothetical protein
MSCQGFFDQYVRWAEPDPPSHLIGFRLVTNERSLVCGYATGFLLYTPGALPTAPAPGTTGTPGTSPGKLEGSATEYFSDRVTATGQPFDPGATDLLTVRVTLSDRPRIRLQFDSWGGGYIIYTAFECREGVLVAAPATPPGAVLLMSFETVTPP